MKLAIVAVSRRPVFAANVIANIQRQNLKPDFVYLAGHGSEVFPLDQQALILPGIQHLMCWAPARDPYGEVLNSCFTVAGEKIGRSGFICTFEDDDHYGPNYLTQVRDMAMKQQDALLIGKASYWTRWPKIHNAHDVLYEHPDQGPHDRVRWIAGGTIAVNAMRWAEWPDLRFSTDAPPIDGKFIQNAWQCWAKRFGVTDQNRKAPIYTTGAGEFLCQRFLEEGHGHTWIHPNDPKV